MTPLEELRDEVRRQIEIERNGEPWLSAEYHRGKRETLEEVLFAVEVICNNEAAEVDDAK